MAHPYLPGSPRGHALRALARKLRRGAGPTPAEPWRADHPWRRDGAVEDTLRLARGVLVGGGILTVFASVLAGLALADAGWPEVALVAGVLGLFLAVGLALVGRGVLLVLRRARHGLSELRFARCPFWMGEPLEVALLRDPGARPLGGLTARLDCVVERWVERPEGVADDSGRHGRAPRLEREVVWTETRPVPLVHGSRLPVRFALPPPGGAAVGTALSANPPRYWELTLWARLPGPDFAAVFLVPVYERPGSSAAARPGS
jgi:hypothetical protein